MERALRNKLPGGKFIGVPPAHSQRMRAIKSKGAKSTERRVRAMMVRAGIGGWTMNAVHLPGKPDFYFPSAKLAVLADGCFWHGCPKCGHVPRINNSYWTAKIKGNRLRDKAHERMLRKVGIRVLRIWEHDLVGGRQRNVLKKLLSLLHAAVE